MTTTRTQLFKLSTGVRKDEIETWYIVRCHACDKEISYAKTQYKSICLECTDSLLKEGRIKGEEQK